MWIFPSAKPGGATLLLYRGTVKKKLKADFDPSLSAPEKAEFVFQKPVVVATIMTTTAMAVQIRNKGRTQQAHRL